MGRFPKRCLRTNVLFLFASVVVIENPGVEIYDGCPTQRCYVRDLWWEGPHNRSMNYNGLVHTKMLRTCNGIAYMKKKKKDVRSGRQFMTRVWTQG